jgi:hypothetical protein
MSRTPSDAPESFGAQNTLRQNYGTLVRRYLEHGSDVAKGGVPENAWVDAREQAGAANVETWWRRYHGETKNKYASREVTVGFAGFVAGLVAAAVVAYFFR